MPRATYLKICLWSVASDPSIWKQAQKGATRPGTRIAALGNGRYVTVVSARTRPRKKCAPRVPYSSGSPSTLACSRTRLRALHFCQNNLWKQFVWKVNRRCKRFFENSRKWQWQWGEVRHSFSEFDLFGRSVETSRGSAARTRGRL